MQESNRKSLLLRMPVLPLRGMMVFPHMVLHFDVGRPKSVAALEKAMMGDQRIFLVAQMDAEIDEPELSDLCRVGTIAQIKQVLNLPGDSIRVLVEGVRRGVLGTVLEEDPCLVATVRLVREDAAPDTAEMKALVRTTHAFFEEYCNASMRVSQETLRSVMDVDKPDQLADIIAANVLTRLEDRQAILEKLKVKDRLEALCRLLQDLGERSQVEDLQSFAEVFLTVKRTGGDLLHVIRNTVSCIRQKQETVAEIETVLTGKMTEQKVMSLMPLLILLYVRLTSPEFLSGMYGNLTGRAVMTVCLLIYAVAYLWGKKIVGIEV